MKRSIAFLAGIGTISRSSKATWIGTATTRLGYAWDRVLFARSARPGRTSTNNANLQRRGAPATRLGYATPSLVKALDPFERRTWADIEQFRCLASRGPAFDARNHSFPNIGRVRLRHGSAPKDESMPVRLSHL